MKINQFQITMLLFMEEIASQNVALYKEKPSPNHLLPKHKGGGGGGGWVRGNEGQILVLQGEG